MSPLPTAIRIGPTSVTKASPLADIRRILPGDTATCESTVSESDVLAFSRLSLDVNPLHLDRDVAGGYGFERPVAHGMLALSIISRLIGTVLPGPGSLWVSQEVKFPSPALVGDRLAGTVSVEQVSLSTGLVVLRTEVINVNTGRPVLSGMARVKVMPPASAAPDIGIDVARRPVAVPRPPITGTPFVARPDPAVKTLVVVVYHYIQDPADARFPGLQGLTVAEFDQQLATLQERYEMATLDSATAFLEGRYRPARSLCLLTFDDGLRDHARHVTPRLASAGLHGVFFVTTSCLDGSVAAVHKNHHLTAALGFDAYRKAFIRRLADTPAAATKPDHARAILAYPWDPPNVADFKYLVNYQLPETIRHSIVNELFAATLGDEADFASELYLSVDDAKAMQAAGMIIGGHSDGHQPLSALPPAAQTRDVSLCARALHTRLDPQPLWPFSYPYGKHDESTAAAVAAAGFQSGFALEGGDNLPGEDVFRIRRVDTKDLAF